MPPMPETPGSEASSQPSDDLAEGQQEEHQELIVRAAELLAQSRYCIALTGAGISAESGIPTFRGKDGLWTKHGEPPLNQYEQFSADPAVWWENVAERRRQPDELTATIASAQPNDAHFAMAELERLGVLKHIITQNVDGLHRAAGAKRLTEIHGCTTLLRCIACGARSPFEEIPEVFPPRCDRCGGIVKTDTVMFGEPIPRDCLDRCYEESSKADCVILVGTTAVVSPAADFALAVRQRGHPMIEVNLDPTVVTSYCNVAIHDKAGELMSRITAEVKRLLAAPVC